MMKEISSRKENILFAGIEFFYWASYTIYYNFMVQFLTDMGYSKSLCGIITMSLTLISVFSAPVMGYLTDTFLTTKRLLLIVFSGSVLISLFLKDLLPVLSLGIFAIVVISMFDYAAYNIIDTWVIKNRDMNPQIDFTHIRMFGTFGAATIAMFGGSVIDRFGTNVAFYGHAIFMVICMLFIMQQRPAPCLNSKKLRAETKAEGEQVNLLTAFKALIKNREYVTFVIAYLFIQFGMRSTFTYLAVFIDAAGGGASEVGIGYGVLFVGETIMVALSTRLLKRGAKASHLYFFSMLIGCLRIFTLLIFKNIYFILIMQFIQALTTGIHVRMLGEYCKTMVPPVLFSTAVTLANSFSYGVGGTLGNLTGGFVLDHFGNDFYVLLSTAMMVIGILIFLPNVIKDYKKMKMREEQLV